MERKKSCTTWDVWNPVDNGRTYLSGTGFQPSTVSFSRSRENTLERHPPANHWIVGIPSLLSAPFRPGRDWASWGIQGERCHKGSHARSLALQIFLSLSKHSRGNSFRAIWGKISDPPKISPIHLHRFAHFTLRLRSSEVIGMIRIFASLRRSFWSMNIIIPLRQHYILDKYFYTIIYKWYH